MGKDLSNKSNMTKASGQEQRPNIKTKFAALIKRMIKNPRSKRRWIFGIAASLLVALLILIIIVLSGNKGTFSIIDFYNNITLYEEKISLIIEENSIELNQQSNNRLLESEIDGVVTLRKEDMLNVYNSSSFNMVYDDYLENLSNTKLFMQEVMAVIDSMDKIKLGEKFYPEKDNFDFSYKFLMSSQDSTVIEKNRGLQFSYIKIGLNKELLEYDEINYAYDLNQETLNIADSLNYANFRFIEGKEALYINSAHDLSSLRYTSIETGQHFTISYGGGVVEGPQYKDIGYAVNAYDALTNSRVFLQVVEGKIISSVYDVFNEHGLLYSLEDLDIFDDEYSLTTNIVSSTGWDYAMVSNVSNLEIDAVKGLYLDDDTKLYQGHLYYTFTPKQAYLGFKQDLTGQIDGNTFSLADYGFLLEDTKFSLSYFNQIKITNFNEIKNQFKIDRLNFFASDLRGELYRYLDVDIRSSIEGEKIEDETTGNITEFLDAFNKFNANLEEKPNLSLSSTNVIKLYDGKKLKDTLTTKSSVSIDINQYYYHQINEVITGSYLKDEKYIMEKDGLLIEFNIEEQTLDYTIISRESNYDSFLNAAQITYIENPLMGFEDIEQKSTYEFRIIVNKNIFATDADMDIVFQQLGLEGLDDASLVMDYLFSPDYMSYETTLTIEGLKTKTYDAIYKVSSETKIQSITLINPLESSSLFSFLPQATSDIIFTTDTDSQSRYYMHEGTASWIRLYLEKGDYEINISGHHTSLNYEIFDSNMILIEENALLHIDQADYYYFKLTTPYEQGIEFLVQKIILPTEFSIALTLEAKNIHIDLIDMYSIYHLLLPSIEEEMILVITKNEPSGEGVWLELDPDDRDYGNSYGLNTCDFRSDKKTCYFYLKPSYDFDLIFSGQYEGAVDLDYEFIKVADFPTEATVADIADAPYLLFLPNGPETKLTFTMTKTLNTKIYLDVFGIYKSYLNVKLYDDQGNLLRDGFATWPYLLTPGTYTVVVYYDYYEEAPLGIIRPFFP